MQVSDNQAVLDSDTAGSNGNNADPSQEPNTIDDRAEAGPPDDSTRKQGFNGGHRFEPGNQLWRQRKPPGLQSSRRALREALHEALTPDKMRDCVAKMLDIIASSDKKAAVQAFKVLADAAGVRGDGDATRHGPSFTFILPGAGAIPTSGAALPVLDAESVEPIEPDES